MNRLRYAIPGFLIAAALTAQLTWSNASRAGDEPQELSHAAAEREKMIGTLRDPGFQAGARAILNAMPDAENTPSLNVVAPKTPPALEAAADFPTTDRFAQYPIVSQVETAADPNGNYTRIRIVRTDMKYPLIRVVQNRQKNFSTGDDRIVQQIAMVADHALIRMQDGVTAEDLQAQFESMGLRIRRRVARGKAALIEFDATDPQTLDRVIADLDQASGVVIAEPDYLQRVL